MSILVCRLVLLWFGWFWLPSLHLVLAQAVESTCEAEETCASEPNAKIFPVPGLRTPHPLPFTPVPPAVKRTVCISDTEWAVIRAFKNRGWNIIRLNSTASPPIYWDCHVKGQASISWLKYHLDYWQRAQPWQRANWLPFQNQMTHKGHFQRNLIAHELRSGRKMPFIPDSYLLPADRERLLKRLQPLTAENPDGGGDREPWVIKLSATDGGVGIAILGPNSTGVQHLNKTLIEYDNPDDYLHPLRESLVLVQENDTRDPEDVEKARQRSLRINDDIVVQRYICHEMAYQGRKFDLRLYYLVASVDPLIVFYHDGSLRVSLSEYNDKIFESTTDHLTNLGRNEAMDNCTISFEDWEVELKRHVAANPSRFPAHVAADPLSHVRNQCKNAIAELVAATRDVAFYGIRNNRTTMENYFSLLGADFILDIDLHVWMTEAQSSPGFGHETKVRRSLYDRFIPSAIDIVAEVMEKQEAGIPLLPINRVGEYQLIYTDEWMYRYDFNHKPYQRGPC